MLIKFSSQNPKYPFLLGLKPVITVNDYETAIKLFINDGDSYADRPRNDYFHKLISGGTYGIGQTSGSIWQEQRRVSLKILRDFGLGKNQVQERVSLM
jgi:cytochrome P450 family 33